MLSAPTIAADTVSQANVSPTALIVLGAFTLLGTLFTGWLTYLTAKGRTAKTEQAERAEQITPPGTDPRLFSMMVNTQEQVNDVSRRLTAQEAHSEQRDRELFREIGALRRIVERVERVVEEHGRRVAERHHPETEERT